MRFLRAAIFITLIVPSSRLNAQPPAYEKLATALSTPYSLEAPAKSELQNPYRLSSMAPDGEKLFKGLLSLLHGKHPMIVAGITALAKAKDQVEIAKSDLQARMKAADDNIEDVKKLAAKGAFITTELRETTRMIRTPSGRIDYEKESVRVDRSEEKIASAIYERDALKAGAPKILAGKTVQAMEQARLDAWQAMIPFLNSVYPSTKLPAGQVELKIVKTDTFYTANTIMVVPESQRLVVTNTGLTPLTNMTLVIELVPFDTAPEPAALQVYYVPKLEAGKTLWLIPHPVRNLLPRQFLLTHPHHGEMRFRGDNHFGVWLSLSDLVEVRCSAWSAQGRQTGTTIPKKDKFSQYAKEEIDDLYCDLVRMAGASPDKKQLDLIVSSDVWAYAQQTGRRFLDYLPADDALRDRAKKLTETPATFLTAERNQRQQAVALATSPDRIYLIKSDSTSSDGAKTIACRMEGRNLAMGSIRAILVDTDDPSRWWRLHGRISGDERNTISLIWLTANPIADSDEEGKVRKLTKSGSAKESGRFFDRPDDLILVVSDDGLVGHWKNESTTNLTLVPTARADVSAAIKAAAATADESEAALIAMIGKGQTYAGEWRVRAEKKVNDARLRAGVRQEGPLSIRFENWNKETHEVTVVLSFRGNEVKRSSYLGRTPNGSVAIELPNTAPPSSKQRKYGNVLKPLEVDPLSTDSVMQLSINEGQLSGRFKPPGTAFWVEIKLETGRAKP